MTDQITLLPLIRTWLKNHRTYKKFHVWDTKPKDVLVIERKSMSKIAAFSDAWYQSTRKNYILSITEDGVVFNRVGVTTFQVALNPADPKFFKRLSSLIKKSLNENC